MRPKIKVCLTCDARYPGCHDKCEKYQAEKQKAFEFKRMIQKEKEKNSRVDHPKNIRRHRPGRLKNIRGEKGGGKNFR